MKDSITWLHVNEYNQRYQDHYLKHDRFHEEKISFAISTEQFEALIPVEPFWAKIDDIGVTKTCFGQVNDHLFYIMNFSESPFPKTILGSDNFEMLAELSDLDPAFFAAINWINNYPQTATHSVFREDEQGRIEVYRAESLDEANTTAFFLNKKSDSDGFHVGEAEALNSTWIVLEKDGENEKEIGRYIDRLSAENFAMDYGRKETKEIIIKQLK